MVNVHVCVCSTAPAPLVCGSDERISCAIHGHTASDSETDTFVRMQKTGGYEDTWLETVEYGACDGGTFRACWRYIQHSYREKVKVGDAHNCVESREETREQER